MCFKCFGGFLFGFCLPCSYFTSFREQHKADINSLQWLAPVGLKPAHTRMRDARSTTVQQTLFAVTQKVKVLNWFGTFTDRIQDSTVDVFPIIKPLFLT